MSFWWAEAKNMQRAWYFSSHKWTGKAFFSIGTKKGVWSKVPKILSFGEESIIDRHTHTHPYLRMEIQSILKKFSLRARQGFDIWTIFGTNFIG